MDVHYQTIVRKQCDVEDSTTTKVRQYFDECFDFVDSARNSGGKVLIHCASGCSRSPTITIAFESHHLALPPLMLFPTRYLMKKHGWSVDRTLAFVQERRKQANPNRTFLSQLRDFENELLAGASDRTD